MASEFTRIAEIRRRLAATPAAATTPDIALGIGDDCALLAASPRAQAISVDAQVEGVHFDRALFSPSDIGFRALAAAVSDLCAMAARPRAAVCAMIVPGDLPDDDLYAIADGLAEAQRVFGCPVAGGNLAGGGPLSLTTTVIGDAPDRAPLRAGARAGEALFVTGTLGASALGLRALRAGRRTLAPGCVERFLRPTARVREGQALAGLASAAIDVSDGLVQDLGHVAEASAVGFELELARLPLHPELVPGCKALGLDPLALALAGGEDYELLFVCPEPLVPRAEALPGVGAVRIGRCTAEPGLRLRDARGQLVAPPAHPGFDHFPSKRS